MYIMETLTCLGDSGILSSSPYTKLPASLKRAAKQYYYSTRSILSTCLKVDFVIFSYYYIQSLSKVRLLVAR